MSLYFRCDAAAIATSTGCKSRYTFMKLPEHDRVGQTVPDAMHTIKDVVERLFKLIIGKSTSDGHRDGCHLSTSDILCADNRIVKINFPSKDFTPGRIFSRPIGLKSHDWKEVRKMWLQVCRVSSRSFGLGWKGRGSFTTYAPPIPEDISFGQQRYYFCRFTVS